MKKVKVLEGKQKQHTTKPSYKQLAEPKLIKIKENIISEKRPIMKTKN